ncbi:MAG: GNAT family N-acetyltransferase [Acidobacteriia bacterium]|nr:GNAT family N-acetyltransferase [Terriglobia bacterium]
MIQLATEFFGAKDDPAQISVTPQDIEKFQKIHPCTMMEEKNEDGPIAWVLVIPTLHELMEQFLAKAITERDLLDRTPLQIRYDALYLCSALVLTEFRGRGLAKLLLSKAIESIQHEHPVRSLFCWPFSPEGERLASHLAQKFGLPLYKRPT